jgi:hypothetical protein
LRSPRVLPLSFAQNRRRTHIVLPINSRLMSCVQRLARCDDVVAGFSHRSCSSEISFSRQRPDHKISDLGTEVPKARKLLYEEEENNTQHRCFSLALSHPAREAMEKKRSHHLEAVQYQRYSGELPVSLSGPIANPTTRHVHFCSLVLSQLDSKLQ